MTQYAVWKYPFLLYDGTNSAAILAMVQDDAEHWSIQSETGGVLTLSGPTDNVSVAEGQIALANNAGGASGLAPMDAALFETRYLRLGD